MKWTERKYSLGDKRIKSHFLLFPRVINEEVRWLEKATWEESWQQGAGPMGVGCHWVAIRWILRG